MIFGDVKAGVAPIQLGFLLQAGLGIPCHIEWGSSIPSRLFPVGHHYSELRQH